MKTLKLQLILFGVLSISMAGCLNWMEANPVGPLPTVNIYLATVPDSTDCALKFHLKGGDYDYRGVRIDAKTRVAGSEIIVHLTGTSCVDPCATAYDDRDRDAHGDLILPHLPNGYYSLRLVTDKESALGAMVVNDELFSISIDLPSGVYFSNGIHGLRKIPHDIIWGEFHNFSGQQGIEDLKNNLSAAGNFTAANLASGRYSEFLIDENGNMSSLSSNGSDFSFINRYNGNMEAMQQAFDNWAQTHELVYPVSVSLQDGKGKSIYLSAP